MSRRGVDARIALAAALASLLLATAGGASAQSSVDHEVARAAALRDAGDLAGAVVVLEQAVLEHPRHVQALRMLAQTLYWLRRDDVAIERYDAAIALAPGDAHLTLEFGRVLIELGRTARARDLLAPLADENRAEAVFLLGLARYWRGDLNGGRDAFRRTLEIDPAHAEAARLLADIRAGASPWLSIEPHGRHDSQDLDRAALAIRAGLFLTPLHSVTFEGAVQRASWTGLDARRTTASIASRWHMAGARLAIAAGMGVSQTTLPSRTVLIGSVSADVRAGGGLQLTAAARRSPYEETVASQTASLTPARLEFRLALDRAGLLGEAGGWLDRFPDDNLVATGYAWLLLPLIVRPRGAIRVGYAFAMQDAAEDRVEAVSPGAQGADAPVYAAVYAPYHTPQRLVSHGIAGSVMLRAGNAFTLRSNGSWGFHAREDAPYFVAADTLPDSPPVRGTYRRAFHPSELRIGTDVRLGPGATFFAEASRRETAFYRVSSARAGVLLRFLPRVR